MLAIHLMTYDEQKTEGNMGYVHEICHVEETFVEILGNAKNDIVTNRHKHTIPK